jgi:hypothetical protein
VIRQRTAFEQVMRASSRTLAFAECAVPPEAMAATGLRSCCSSSSPPTRALPTGSSTPRPALRNAQRVSAARNSARP